MLELVGMGVLALAALLTGVLDWRTGRIPDWVSLGGAALLLLLSLAGGWADLLAALLGLGVAGGLFLLVRLARPGGMGWGDVKFAATMGAGLGLPAVFVALLFACVLVFVWYLLHWMLRRTTWRGRFAFGPFLAGGVLLVLAAKLSGLASLLELPPL